MPCPALHCTARPNPTKEASKLAIDVVGVRGGSGRHTSNDWLWLAHSDCLTNHCSFPFPATILESHAAVLQVANMMVWLRILKWPREHLIPRSAQDEV